MRRFEVRETYDPSKYESPPIWTRGRGADRRSYWPHLIGRIALSGGVFGWGVVIGWAGFLFLQMAQSEPEELPVVAIGAVVGSMLGAFFGSVWALICGSLVSVVTLVALRIMDAAPPRDVLGMFVGGASAFLATAGLWCGVVDSSDSAQTTLLIWLHLAAAIFLGQWAGVGASLAEMRRRRRGTRRIKRLRVSVWHVLAGTVPIAAILSLLRVTGLLQPEVGLAVVAAGVTSLGTAPIVRMAINHRADRRLRRRREARLAAGRST